MAGVACLADAGADAVNRPAITVWRHPLPKGVAGRCIGRTDVPVDRRKAKRLAHRVRNAARREGHPPVVWTSPLRRGADVGRWLLRWGWTHRVDPRLAELDFGRWDGQRWDDIGADAVGAWCDDFAQGAPGGGESVTALMSRCAAFVREHPDAWVVGHGGWINALARVVRGLPPPAGPAEWPPAIGYNAAWRASSSLGAESQ